MGNALKKEFDLSEDQCCSGGLGLRYKIFDAVEKSTQMKVSVFRFDKRGLPKNLKTDEYYNIFRNEVTKGMILKHPNILQVKREKQESSSEMVFVTERIVSSLANLLGDDNNLPNVPDFVKNYKFTELDIKTGLGQLCEATMFLHNKAKKVHLFINPCNIYLTEKGDWKLFGFGFCKDFHQKDIGIEYDFTDDNKTPFLPGFLVWLLNWL
eukprot:UN34400